MKAAKAYYVKRNKDEYLIKKNKFLIDSCESIEGKIDLTKEDISIILSDPRLIEVLDIVKDSPNYATVFVKFRFEQGADVENLKQLMILLKDQQVKSFLKELPLKNVESYSKIKYTDQKDGHMFNPIPGWMVLIDDIGKLQAIQEGKWIIKSFVTRAGIRDTSGMIISGKIGVNQKELYKNASIDIQNRIIKLAGDMKRTDKTGNLIAGFTRKMSNYETLDIIIEGLTDVINAVGTKKEEMSIRLGEAYPGASVVWENSNKILVLYRSPNVLGDTCRHTTWCLKPSGYGAGSAGSFYNYVKDGSVQYVMWDFSKDPADDMNIVGFTVKPSGHISHAHNKSDIDVKRKTGPTLSSVLSYYKVPIYAQDQIKKSLPNESKFMKEIEPIYRTIQGRSGKGLKDVITELIKNAEKRAHRARFYSIDDTFSYILDRIITAELTNSSDINEIRKIVWDNLSDPTRGGLTNVESARFYKSIFNKSNYINKDNIGVLININNQKSMRAGKILLMANGDLKKDKNKVNKYSVKYKTSLDDITNRATILMESIVKANIYLQKLK